MNFKKTIASVAVVSLCLLNIGIASALPTIQSALDETFSKNQAPEQLSNITITEDAEESFIKEGVLKITIPDTLEMIFDTERTVLEFTVFGTAVDNGKVLAEPVLTFEDGDKTLVVPIEEDFEPGEVLTITKCYVEGFHSTSISSDHLELTVNDDPTIYEDSADLNITISTYSDSRDPDAPSNIEIQDTEGGVKMTWTDPTDLDLYRIKILRGKNDAPVDGTPYVEVLPGEEEYIDTDVVEGDTVKYMFRASDGPNTGDTTVEHVFVVGSTIVEEPEAEPEVEPVVEDTDEDPEPVLINEEGFCTLEYLPVCSANGVTYPNSCVAEKSGATVETEGECETPYCEVTDEPVCGVDGITYPNGCSLEKNDIMKAYDGECDIEYCPVEYEPVCAADGETYTNECVAEKAGTEMSTFGECSETEDEPLFTDTETHWAKDKVESMAEKEIVEGNEDGSFNPDGTINRAEAAAMLYRLLGLGEPEMPEAKPFDDIEKDLWFSGYISELKTLELASGKTETTYVPGEEMNRAEFLQMAMNVYYYMTETELAATAITSDFTDLPEDAWYSLTITEAYKMDFVSGKTETTYGPEDPISRAEAASILYNMFYELI